MHRRFVRWTSREMGSPSRSRRTPRLTPPWILQEVATAIPGAELRIFRGEGSSHLLPLARPAEFNQLVTSFLSESVRTTRAGHPGDMVVT